MSLIAEKAERRNFYRGLQRSYSEDQFREWNRGLAPRLLSTLKNTPPRAILGAYRARPTEASLLPMFGLPFRFCFPRVIPGGDGAMSFHVVEKAKENSNFVIGSFGILEPEETCPLATPEEMFAIFVPLLAFDGNGGRLGYGKGHYDRVLGKVSGLKIGVAFEWQFSRDALPLEAHDLKLDLVVTEKSVRDFRS